MPWIIHIIFISSVHRLLWLLSHLNIEQKRKETNWLPISLESNTYTNYVAILMWIFDNSRRCFRQQWRPRQLQLQEVVASNKHPRLLATRPTLRVPWKAAPLYLSLQVQPHPQPRHRVPIWKVNQNAFTSAIYLSVFETLISGQCSGWVSFFFCAKRLVSLTIIDFFFFFHYQSTIFD